MPVAISLPGVMLNAVADPTDAVLIDATLSDTPNTGGTVRPYGGGRMRYVQGKARTRALPLTLDTVTPAQLAWLEGHLGQLCCLRDPFGRRVFGVFAGYTATPYPSGAQNLHAVSGLQFQGVTRFESV